MLGKNCPPLREILEHPEINEAKAFEALVELSVITRLLSDSKNSHKFVPRHQSVTDDNSFDATEIIYVHQSKVHLTIRGSNSGVKAKTWNCSSLLPYFNMHSTC